MKTLTLAAIFEGLVRLKEKPQMRAKYADYIDAYACLTEDEMLRFEQEELSRREDAPMEYWQVRQERWRQEGRQEGRTGLLLGLLQSRGLEPSEEARQRIESETDPDRILQWAMRASTVQSIDDLFDP